LWLCAGKRSEFYPGLNEVGPKTYREVENYERRKGWLG
jgi:hypothetical protein